MAEVVAIEFPGTTGSAYLAAAFERLAGLRVRPVWHEESDFGAADILLLPDGASFSDYLRPGALARTSPVAPAIRRFARERPVLGVGNGFSILCELGVLPGTLLANGSLRLCSQTALVKPVKNICPLAASLAPERVLAVQVSTFHGRYFADHRTLSDLEEQQRVVFRFCNEYAEESLDYSLTGSERSIAGVCSLKGNVLGFVGLPERGGQGDEILRAAITFLGA